MNDLRTGVLMKSDTLLVRAALLCVTCDIPAAKKVCGFMGHAGCLLSFRKGDYSNYEKTQWTERTIEDHNSKADAHSKCSTLKD